MCAERRWGTADTAFTHAMHITTVIAAAMMLAGTFVIVKWMPGKDVAA